MNGKALISTILEFGENKEVLVIDWTGKKCKVTNVFVANDESWDGKDKIFLDIEER
jgi:hypothetical protein